METDNYLQPFIDFSNSFGHTNLDFMQILNITMGYGV